MAILNFSIEETGRKKPLYEVEGVPAGTNLADLLSYTKEALIATTNTVLKDEQSRGFDKDPLILVDNKRGRSLELVKPLGKIEIYSKLSGIAQPLLDLYQGIRRRSPKVSGNYDKYNAVYYNGKLIGDDYNEVKAWFDTNETKVKQGDRFRFVNRAPYALALELKGVTRGNVKGRTAKVGKKGAKKTTVRKPNGTYYLSYIAARKKIGKNVKIKFEMLPGSYFGFTNPITPSGGRSFRTTFHEKNTKYKGYYVYPSITVGIFKEGVVLQ
jgi:hypothetical protein